MAGRVMRVGTKRLTDVHSCDRERPWADRQTLGTVWECSCGKQWIVKSWKHNGKTYFDWKRKWLRFGFNDGSMP